VPAGNARALEAALRRLVQQPELRLELGERAKAHVTRTYDAAHNANLLLKLLKAEVNAARLRQGGAA